MIFHNQFLKFPRTLLFFSFIPVKSYEKDQHLGAENIFFFFLKMALFKDEGCGIFHERSMDVMLHPIFSGYK